MDPTCFVITWCGSFTHRYNKLTIGVLMVFLPWLLTFSFVDPVIDQGDGIAVPVKTVTQIPYGAPTSYTAKPMYAAVPDDQVADGN